MIGLGVECRTLDCRKLIRFILKKKKFIDFILKKKNGQFIQKNKKFSLSKN